MVYEDDDKLVVGQEQFMRFNTAARKGLLSGQTVSWLVKENNKVYDKGIIENRAVRPFSADMVEVIG